MKILRAFAAIGAALIICLPASSSVTSGCYSYTSCFGSSSGSIGSEDPFAEHTDAAFQSFMAEFQSYGCGYGDDDCPVPDLVKRCKDACMALYAMNASSCAAMGVGSVSGALCFAAAANNLAQCFRDCDS